MPRVFPAVDEQHGHVPAVLALERRVRVDVDIFHVKRHIAGDALDDEAAGGAKVAIGASIKRQ